MDELLDRLRLAHLANANPYTLSGGEQRRLSVATALAAAPRVLVLDEPTFGQDRRTWTELVDLVAAVRDEGRGVVAVTHDTDFVAALADRELVLADGPPARGGARRMRFTPAGRRPDRPPGPAQPHRQARRRFALTLLLVIVAGPGDPGRGARGRAGRPAAVRAELPAAVPAAAGR